MILLSSVTCWSRKESAAGPFGVEEPLPRWYLMWLSSLPKCASPQYSRGTDMTW